MDLLTTGPPDGAPFRLARLIQLVDLRHVYWALTVPANHENREAYSCRHFSPFHYTSPYMRSTSCPVSRLAYVDRWACIDPYCVATPTMEAFAKTHDLFNQALRPAPYPTLQ